MRDIVSTGTDNSFKGQDDESSDEDLNQENGSNNSDAEVEDVSGEEAEVSGEDESEAEEKSEGDGEGDSEEEVVAFSSKSVPIKNPFFNAESEDDDESMDNDSDEASDIETADADINTMLAERKLAQIAGKRKADSKLTESTNKRKVAANDSSDSDSDFDENASDSDEEVEEKKESFPEEKLEEEDELITALRAARENVVRVCPPAIKLKDSVTDISFHPEEDIIAVSNICGELAFFSYSNEGNKIERKLKLHKSSIRCLEYSEEGDTIFTGGLDNYIKVVNVETGQVEEGNYKHPSSLYSMCAMQHGAASGDEDGTVKLWDFRMKKSTKTSKKFEDFVSSLFYQEQKQRLIASSGEGTIQTWDLRKNCVEMQSEVYKSELNCLAVVKKDTKLVVGSSDGTLYLFEEGLYGYHSDLYPGHPGAINDMVAVTDNIVITGCEDGILRAVHLFPHRFIGQVGQHGGDMPSEKLDVNGAGNLIASTSLSNHVSFWDISYLEKMVYETTKKPVQNKGRKVRPMDAAVYKEAEYQLPSSSKVNKGDFFKDMLDD